MLTTTLSFDNLHNHGEFFANMLRARRELFIVHNKWNLPEAMGMAAAARGGADLFYALSAEALSA